MSDVRSGEGGPPPADGPPPPSPLTGAYLLIVLPQLHSDQHKDRLLHALTKGLITWDIQDCHVDLDKELQTITSQAPEGEEAKNGERLIQFASENLVTEVLIHPQLNTLVQCMKNCLSSFTRHRHIVHAGYTSTGNGAWILQDGTFSLSDFADIYAEPEVQRVLRAYEGTVSVDVHCSSEGDWWALKAKDPFSKVSRVRLNPPDKGSASESVRDFLSYLSGYLKGADLQELLQSSDVVGNIRFSHPTLYVFPGGQGDAALFGINGFNMLVDGGFSRKSCFWDFTRHLDRLDSVLMTRINNGNIQGLASLLRRKRTEQVYPQIGHFFCNIPDRKQILSPDGDKDRDPLRVSLMEEGQEMLTSLRSLGLRPQSCYRESFVEPLNLYHKVGHGKLDMYVLSPAKDSREVREFLAKWIAVDSKIFCSYNRKGEFNFPLSSKTSICALLVWQPANPEDNITRLLFPGSTPQQKIFEGLDRLKTLEFMKHPTCTGKSLSPTSSTLGLSIKAKPKAPIIEKMDTEKKQIEPTKAVKPAEAKPKALPPKPKPKLDRPKETKPKTDLDINKPETVKIDKKPEAVQKEKDIKKEKPKRPIQKSAEKKPQKPAEKKTESVKSSPTTPKKTVENKLNEISGKIEQKPRASKSKASPSATPAKSAKEANNRKVVELKSREVRPQKPAPAKKDEPKRTDKPAAKKTTGAPKSPVKVTRPGAKQKLDVKKQVKNDKDITTDSSAVSTPSTVDAELIKVKEDAEKPKESEESKTLNDLDLSRKESEDKGKSLSKEEEDEILIIEKVEISNEITGTRDVESINVHLQKIDEEKLQKVKAAAEIEEKENGEKTLVVSTAPALPGHVQDEVQDIIESATEIVSKTKEIQKIDSEISGKDFAATDKLVTSKDKELKSAETLELKVADESQPDEKFSTTVESGATTTAPTLPEDERIPLDEIKEGIEEKHVKEDTKEKEVITVRPEQPTSLPQVPVIAGTAFDQRAQLLKDIVKTPDEVADLPVHEEVDMEIYEGSLPLPAVKRDRKDESTEELKFIKDGLEKEDKNKDLREDLGESVDVYSHTTTDLDFVSSSPKSGKQLAESTEEKEEFEEKMDETKEKQQKKEELIQKTEEDKDDVADKTPVLEDIQKVMDESLVKPSVTVKDVKVEKSFEKPGVQEKGEPSITKIVEKELSEKTEKEMKVQPSEVEVQKESEIIEKEVDKPSEVETKAAVQDEKDLKGETKVLLEEIEKDQIEKSDKLKLEKLMDETEVKPEVEIELKDELVEVTKKIEDYVPDLGKEELVKTIPSKDEKGMELTKDEMDIGKGDEKETLAAASKVETEEPSGTKLTEKEVLSEDREIEAPLTKEKEMEKHTFAEEKRLEKESLSEERRREKEEYAEERRLEKEALAEERELEKKALAEERKVEKEALAEERKLEKEALAEERKLEKEALSEERKLEKEALAERKKLEKEADIEEKGIDKDSSTLEENVQQVVIVLEEKTEKEPLVEEKKLEKQSLAQNKKEEKEALDAEEKLDKEILTEEKKSEEEAHYKEKKLEKIALAEEIMVGKEVFAVEGTTKKEVLTEEIKTEKETSVMEEIDKEAVAKEEKIEKQTLAEEKRLEEKALDEERKLEKEAFAEERRLEKEAYADERRLEKEAIDEERRLEKEAIAEERKLEKEAFAKEMEKEKEAIAQERKIENEAIAEERKIEKEAQVQKREEKEAAAEEKKIEKEAFFEEKKDVAEEKGVEKKTPAEERRLEKEALAEERKLEKEALSEERKLEKEALAEERRVEKEALADERKQEKEAFAEEKQKEKEAFAEVLRVEKEAVAEKKKVEKEALAEEKEEEEDTLAEKKEAGKGVLKVEKEEFSQKIEKELSEKQNKGEDTRKVSLDKGEATFLENGFDTMESKIEVTKNDIFKTEDKISEEEDVQLEITLKDEEKKHDKEITIEKSEVAEVNEKNVVAADSKLSEATKDETEDITTVKTVSVGGNIVTDITEDAKTYTIKIQETEAELGKIDGKPHVKEDIKEKSLSEKPCSQIEVVSEPLLSGKSVKGVAKSIEEVSHEITAAIPEEEIGIVTLAEEKRLEGEGLPEEKRTEKETLAEERKLEKEEYAEERRLEKQAFAEERRLEKEAIAEERRLEKLAFAEERRLEKEAIAEERRVEKEALAEERKLEKETLAEERKLEKESLVVEKKLEKDAPAEESKFEEKELDEERKLEKEKLGEEKGVEKEVFDEKKSVEKGGIVEKPERPGELETKGIIKEEVLQGPVDGTKDGDGMKGKDEHTSPDRDDKASKHEETTIVKELTKSGEKITSEFKEFDSSKLTETLKTPGGEPLSQNKDSKSNISLESEIFEKTEIVETEEKTEKSETGTKPFEEAIFLKSDEKVVGSSITEKEKQPIIGEKPSLKEVEIYTSPDKELEKKAVESSKEKISSEEKESDDQEISKEDLSTKLDVKASTNVLSQEESSVEGLVKIEKIVEETEIHVSEKSDEKVTAEREFLAKAENEGKVDDIKHKEETELLKDIKEEFVLSKEEFVLSKEEQFDGVIKEASTSSGDTHDIKTKAESIAEITEEKILPKPSDIAKEEPILDVDSKSFVLHMEKHLVQRDEISPKESLLTSESKLQEKEEGLEKHGDFVKLKDELKSGEEVDEKLESGETAGKSVDVPKKEESKTEEKTGDIAREELFLKSDEKIKEELGASKSQKASEAADSQESKKSIGTIKTDMPSSESAKVDMRTDSAKDEDIDKEDVLGKHEEKLEKQADGDMRKSPAKPTVAEEFEAKSTDVNKMELEVEQDDKVTKVTDTKGVKSEEHLDKTAADKPLAKDEMEDTDDDKPAAKLDLGAKREDKVQSDESRHFEEKIVEKEALAEERRAEKEALAEERKQEKEAFAEERRLEKEAFAEERRLEKEAIAEERRLEKVAIAEERRLEKEELAEERRLEKEAIAEERKLDKVVGEKSEWVGKQRDSDEIKSGHKETDEIKFEKKIEETYFAAKDMEEKTHPVDVHLKGSTQFDSKDDAKDSIQVVESEEKNEGETTRTHSEVERKLSVSAEQKSEEKTELSLDKKEKDIREDEKDILKESKGLSKEEREKEEKEETQRLASQAQTTIEPKELKTIDEMKLIKKEFLDEAQGIKQKEMDAYDSLSDIHDSTTSTVLAEPKTRKDSLSFPDIVTIKDEQLGSSKADKKEEKDETAGFEAKIDKKAFSETTETPFKGEAKTGKEIAEKYSKVKTDISVTQSHLTEKDVLGAQETDKDPIVTKESPKDKVEVPPSGKSKPAEKVGDIPPTKEEETLKVSSKTCESESVASIAKSTKVNGFAEAQKLEESSSFTTAVEGKVEDEHKKDSSEVFISKDTVHSLDEVELSQTVLETGTISGKGEKENVNADLKSKMVEEKQGSAAEKISGKIEDIDSHFSTGTASGESSSHVMKLESAGEDFKITNGKEFSSSSSTAQESAGQKETDLESALESSIVKKEADISNGKSEEIKASSVPKMTSTSAVGKSEELGTATVRKGSNGTSAIDKKEFCAVSCSEPKKTCGTDFSLESTSSKDETLCKVEKIVAEKHEIESVKDVSVVKGKLISDVGDMLNGASAHSSSEKITNGSGPSHTVTTVHTVYTKDIPGTSTESSKVITEIPEASPLHKLLTSKFESCEVSSLRESLSGPRGSLEATPEGRGSPASDASAIGWRESDDDLPASPLSTTSHLHSPPPAMFSSTIRYSDDDSDTSLGRPDIDFESALREHQEARGEKKDPIEKWDKPLGLPPPPPRRSSPVSEWGRPLRLPSPAPPREEENNDDTSGSAKTTPKKVAKMNEENNRLASNITLGKEANNKNKRSDSPVKRNTREGRKSGMNHIYLDLSYVPHHGNSHYANVEFFKRVRARYYVLSGTEPSKDVFNALLEAKQTWEDKDLEVTIIPSYDTDTLGYWITENEELLSKYKIDLSPSASRCTINLQDHDTSCSAYRLEF